MTAGVPKLRKMQIGAEATPGTEVDATEIWRAEVGDIENLSTLEFIEEQVGNLLWQTDRANITAVDAQVTLPEQPFTFEQFPWLCHAGVEAQAAGVQDGAGDGHIYTFDFGTTAKKTLKTITVEVGDNNAGHLMTHGYCPSFNLRGAQNANVMQGGMLHGREKLTTTLTAALTPAAVHQAPFNLSTFYIEAAAGTYGTTNIPATLMGFDLSVETGVVPVVAADGQLYFSETDQTGAIIALNVVFRYNAAATAELAAALNEATKLVQLKITGAAFGTGGTDYDRYTALINLPGKWEIWQPWGETAGLTTVSGTFRAGYNSVDGGPQIIVVNERASYWA